jgi:hypothetical protein
MQGVPVTHQVASAPARALEPTVRAAAIQAANRAVAAREAKA